MRKGGWPYKNAKGISVAKFGEFIQYTGSSPLSSSSNICCQHHGGVPAVGTPFFKRCSHGAADDIYRNGMAVRRHCEPLRKISPVALDVLDVDILIAGTCLGDARQMDKYRGVGVAAPWIKAGGCACG